MIVYWRVSTKKSTGILRMVVLKIKKSNFKIGFHTYKMASSRFCLKAREAASDATYEDGRNREIIDAFGTRIRRYIPPFFQKRLCARLCQLNWMLLRPEGQFQKCLAPINQ